MSFDQKEGWAPNSYLEAIHGSESPSLLNTSPVTSRKLRTSPSPTGSSSGHTSPDELGMNYDYNCLIDYYYNSTIYA